MNFKEANVNAVDEDGDSCLHLALNDKLSISDPASQTTNPSSKYTNLSTDLKDCKLLLMVFNLPSQIGFIKLY